VSQTQIMLWADQELPSTPFVWNDTNGTLIDFSSGYTFTLEISRNGTIVASKTSGITGAATSPNVIIDWAAGEVAALSDLYDVRLIARRTSDSKDRPFPQRLTLRVNAVPVAAP
jgi:hypothetical protein